MKVNEQHYLEIARVALSECGTAAEIQYVADSMSRFLSEPRSLQILTDLVTRHLHPHPQSVPA